MFGLVHDKNVFIKVFMILYLLIFGGSLIKVDQKVVNTILWQSPSPISQTPVFCKKFGLFVSNTSYKVPLAVLKQVGILTKFLTK